MSIAACAEIDDETGLFQPTHGSAPVTMGIERANPIVAILSGVMILDYLADKSDLPHYAAASFKLGLDITVAFTQNSVRPIEFGGYMSTKSVTNAISATCQSLAPEL